MLMEMKIPSLILALMIVLAGCLSGEPDGGTNASPAGFDPASYGSPHPKVPASHPACCEHPYWHKIYRATSTDGVEWRSEGLLLEHASVPEALVLDNGTVILYYVDGLYDTFDCIISPDGKVFSYGNCTIYGFTEERAWDPTVVSLGNGSYRLYFYSPAPKETHSENRIMSAISDDGVNWVQEPGVRFAHANITDPDVAKIGGYWRMYSYHGIKIVLSRSEDGLAFVKEAELNVSEGIVDLVVLDDGGYAMYLDCIDRAVSGDGLNWNGRIAVMREEGGIRACMPAVAKTKGGYIMYYLGTNLSSG